MSQEILDAHNYYRTEVGVPPLQWSENLQFGSKTIGIPRPLAAG